MNILIKKFAEKNDISEEKATEAMNNACIGIVKTYKRAAEAITTAWTKVTQSEDFKTVLQMCKDEQNEKYKKHQKYEKRVKNRQKLFEKRKKLGRV